VTVSLLAPHWQVGPLSVVPQGDQFLVGDAATGVFVLLPKVGVTVIDGLRAGTPPDALAAQAQECAGEPVDLAEFIAALQDLGFVRPTDNESSTGSSAPSAVQSPEPQPARARVLDALARAAYGRVAWSGYAAATGLAMALLVRRPRLVPRVDDLFFLSTPARSLAALTALTYLLAIAHEGAHWLAARAVGVRGSVTLSRRLYALTLETDLTGLWALPRRRRISPLLAGMAFDATVLAAVLTARSVDGPAGITYPSAVGHLLAALTFVQIAAIGTQFWVFVRTDVYALLVTATGCVNLYRTTQLALLATARLANPAQRRELMAAPQRDRQVARWYRWLWLLGMGLAAWFFVTYFLPAVIRTVRWVGSTVAAADPGSGRFWEAIALAVVLLSPTVLTLGVLARDTRLALQCVSRRLRPPVNRPGRGSTPRSG
jgi:putative peptide zinc metalloprotease protein